MKKNGAMAARIIVAVVCLPILMAVLFFAPPIALPIALAILSVIAVYELLSSAPNKLSKILIALSFIFAALIPFWIYFDSKQFAAIFGLFFFVIIVFTEAVIDHNSMSFEDICLVFFTAVVIPFFLSSLIRIASFEYGRAYLLLPFLTAFGTDIFAFFVGIKFGKHKIAPEISPKKSLEGCIGGFLGSIICVLVYSFIIQAYFGYRCSYPELIFYGFAGGFVAEIGDFSMSLIKRQYKIKDFGNLLPGHGGILDRFDSVLFAAPMMEILIQMMPALVRING